MRELKFTFLNGLVPVLPVNKEIIKPNEMRFLKVEAPFGDEISGLGIIILLELDTYFTLTVKVKFERRNNI